MTGAIAEPAPAQLWTVLHTGAVAEAEDIPARFDRNGFAVWDARSREEACNVRTDVAKLLDDLGLTPDFEIATHCHSHHHPAFVRLTGRSPGYPDSMGCHDFWSEWGNLAWTPTAF